LSPRWSGSPPAASTPRRHSAWRNEFSRVNGAIGDDLEGVDHIPVAALGIVSQLSDRVPGRQALDTPCRLANFESPLEKLTDRASCGRERGRMGQSLVWITDRGIRGCACSQCEWSYTIPTLLTDPKANEVYDRLASPNRVTAELRTPVLTPGCVCGHVNGSSAEITNFYDWRATL
jgi:hypothetical protein